MIVRLLDNVVYQAFPFPKLIWANTKVRCGSSRTDERQVRWVALGRTKLLPVLSDEWERAKYLDEKLFKVTTALSIAVTAAGVASKSLLEALPVGPFKIVITAGLLYAIISLFAGVLMGFAGLRPKPRAGFGPDFALRVRRDDHVAARAIAEALMHFETNNLIRSNEATAAIMAIRNGVIAFAIAMTVSLFIPSQKAENVPSSNHFISISIKSQAKDTPESVPSNSEMQSIAPDVDVSSSPNDISMSPTSEAALGNAKTGPK